MIRVVPIQTYGPIETGALMREAGQIGFPAKDRHLPRWNPFFMKEVIIKVAPRRMRLPSLTYRYTMSVIIHFAQRI